MERWQAVCADADVVVVLIGSICLSCAGAVHDCPALHTDAWSRSVDIEVFLEQSFDVDEQLSVSTANSQLAAIYASFAVEEGFEEGGDTVLAVLDGRLQVLPRLVQVLEEQYAAAFYNSVSPAVAPT